MTDALELMLEVDHIAFGTRSLDRAQEQLSDLGCRTRLRQRPSGPGEDGKHRARTVSVMLDDGYPDIVEFADAVSDLSPTGVILRIERLAETRTRLMEAGVRCGNPYTIARRFGGAGPDQRYEIFGITLRHPCGLPQSLIQTCPTQPMQNLTPHRASASSLAEAARLVGVDLSAT